MGKWDGLDEVEIEAEYPGARDGLPRGAWFFHGPGEEKALPSLPGGWAR